MTPTSKLYLKGILYTSFICAACQNFVFLLTNKGLAIDPFAIFLFLLFGIAIGGYAVERHLSSLKKMEISNITDENLSVKQTRIVITNNSPDFVADQIKQNMSFNLATKRISENCIKIKSRNKWWQRQSKTLITIKKLNENYEYKIVSSPRSKLTLVDNGENLKIVMKLADIIKNVA